MTKADIVDRVANATGLTKLETEAVVEGLLVTIKEALKSNERIEIRGFGSFSVKKRAPRKARNPQTNEEILVPEHYAPVFKASKDLSRSVDAALSE